jgi:hypothetical protein
MIVIEVVVDPKIQIYFYNYPAFPRGNQPPPWSVYFLVPILCSLWSRYTYPVHNQHE